MNAWTFVALASLLPFVSFAAPQVADPTYATPATSPRGTAISCRVTQPNGNQPPEFGRTEPPRADDARYEGGYGNAALWTNLWMWGEGEVPVPSSHTQPDGSLGPMKWAWYRYVPGQLTIDGRRLDAPAPPLQADIPTGYGEAGFQVSGITFPTEGCWEITGRLGDERLTFVTIVIPPAAPRLPSTG